MKLLEKLLLIFQRVIINKFIYLLDSNIINNYIVKNNRYLNIYLFIYILFWAYI